MKAPITRTLRINVDVAAAKVKILEIVRDAIGNPNQKMHGGTTGLSHGTEV